MASAGTGLITSIQCQALEPVCYVASWPGYEVCYLHLYIGTVQILHLTKRSTWYVHEEKWPPWFNTLLSHHCCFNIHIHTFSPFSFVCIAYELLKIFLVNWTFSIFSVDAMAEYYAIRAHHSDFYLLHDQKCYILKSTAFGRRVYVYRRATCWVGLVDTANLNKWIVFLRINTPSLQNV